MDPAKGAEILRELLAKDPTDGSALIALGKYEVSSGKPREAELLFERATAAEESAADAWIELTKVRVEGRRYAEALEAVDEALKLRPGDQLEDYRKALVRLVEAAG